MLKYFIYFSIYFTGVFLLCSCSAPKSDKWVLLSQINKDFRIIRDKQVESYLKKLELQLFDQNKKDLRILIADNDSDFALTFGSGIILLSKSLVLSCKNESELAFIIAHENAHLELEHFEQDKSALSDITVKERELLADSKALETIYEAGFSIKGSVESVKKFNHAGGSKELSGYINENLTTMPYTEQRIRNLKKTLEDKICPDSNCFTSGILDSRQFQAFKSRLDDI